MATSLNFKPLIAAGTVLGIGMGGFADGIFLHQILQVHHVIQRAPMPAQLYWDLAFLAFGGVFMIVLGRYQIRKATSEVHEAGVSSRLRRAA